MKKISLILLMVSGFVDSAQRHVDPAATAVSDPIETALRGSFASNVDLRLVSLRALYSHALAGRIVVEHFDRLLEVALKGITTAENTDIFSTSFFLLCWLIEQGGIGADRFNEVFDVLIDGLLLSQDGSNARSSYQILLATLFKQKIVYEDDELIDALLSNAIEKLTNDVPVDSARVARLILDLMINHGLIRSPGHIDMVYDFLIKQLRTGNKDIKVKSLQNLRSIVEQPVSLRPEMVQQILDISQKGHLSGQDELIQIVSGQLLKSIILRQRREGVQAAAAKSSGTALEEPNFSQIASASAAGGAHHTGDQLKTHAHRDVDAAAAVTDLRLKSEQAIVAKTPVNFSSGAALGAPVIGELHPVASTVTHQQRAGSSGAAKGLGKHVAKQPKAAARNLPSADNDDEGEDDK